MYSYIVPCKCQTLESMCGGGARGKKQDQLVIQGSGLSAKVFWN